MKHTYRPIALFIMGFAPAAMAETAAPIPASPPTSATEPAPSTSSAPPSAAASSPAPSSTPNGATMGTYPLNRTTAPGGVTTAGEEKKEDNGHSGEFFYLRAGAGFSFMGLNTFTSDKLGFEKSSISGPIVDVAGGLRLFIFTVGPRFRYSMYSAFNMWQLEAEVGVHIPAGQWDPYLSASGGFAQVGAISADAIANAATTTIDVGDVNIKGWTASLNIGADYYPVRFFSVGAAASMQLLFLYRAVLAGSPDPTFGTAGASGGIGGTFGLHVGLHL